MDVVEIVYLWATKVVVDVRTLKRYLCSKVSNAYVSDGTFPIARTLAQSDKERIASILGDDVISRYVFDDSTIYTLDSKGRAEGIKHAYATDADIAKSAIRSCTKLNG